VLNAGKTKIPSNLAYAKEVEGKIKKRTEWDFAFIHFDNNKGFVSPAVVSKHGIVDGQTVKSLVVYDYDKKKDSWNWVCLNIYKKK
jgi:hypothetical protein